MEVHTFFGGTSGCLRWLGIRKGGREQRKRKKVRADRPGPKTLRAMLSDERKPIFPVSMVMQKGWGFVL